MFMARLSLFSFLFACAVISSNALAACWWQWEGVKSRWVCDECGSDGCTEIGSAGPTEQTITITNKCYKSGKISVAAYYLAASTNSWRTDGYWNLKPDETAVVGKTYNGLFYYWAKDYASNRTWDGNEGPYMLHGNSHRFRESNSLQIKLTCR